MSLDVKLDLLLQPPPIGYLEQRPSMVILMMGILLKRALSRHIELQELNLNRQLVIWAIASMITRANMHSSNSQQVSKENTKSN